MSDIEAKCNFRNAGARVCAGCYHFVMGAAYGDSCCGNCELHKIGWDEFGNKKSQAKYNWDNRHFGEWVCDDWKPRK